MLWSALLLPPGPGGTPPPPEALRCLAGWALQFTPRVAVSEEAVLLEVAASVRLFGGAPALRDRLAADCAEQGVTAVAWARTGLAAHALARAGVADGLQRPWPEALDGLPLQTLSAVRPHQETLARLGCRTLGDLRRLPRGGVGRRFDAAVLLALDRAYGAQPEAHAWVQAPEGFQAGLALMARVEAAPALLSGAWQLLRQMSAWLAARLSGTTAFTLRWTHDAMRSRDAGAGDALTVRTAVPVQDVERLGRLLAERLAEVRLSAPVGHLELCTVEVVPLADRSACLLPDPAQQAESLHWVLERIAARLGPQRVLYPVLLDDHRLEWQQRWQSAPGASPRRGARPVDEAPQPTWVLPEPVKLTTQGAHPVYQGPLRLLAGPHRVEGGWWHRLGEGGTATTAHVQRDYWVALSEQAGVLWIFQERLASDDSAWYLHGVFA